MATARRRNRQVVAAAKPTDDVAATLTLAAEAFVVRTGHAAVRLSDGSVLLAGGGPGGDATTESFVYLRSPRGSLPHDPRHPGGIPLVTSV